MIIVLLGPPGSGKGTQAKKLEANRNWRHLSTGDMLRSAIQNQTDLGVKAKSYMDQGELVPDEVVVGLIEEQIQGSQSRGFILDGFPRTLGQARSLEGMLKNQGKQVDKAVLFEIDDETVISRLSGRRICPDCGGMYHVESAPPKDDLLCDQCRSTLIQRDDDKKEVVENRVKVYREQTAPLIDFYNQSGKLRRIDGAKNFEQVESALNEAVSEP